MNGRTRVRGLIRRAVLIALVTAVAVTVTGAPASADKPLFQDHIKFSDELHELPELTAACGFPVFHEERVNLIRRIYPDGTEELRLSIHETLVNPDSGEVLEHHLAGSQTIEGTRTAEGDQLVIDVETRHVGLPSHWRKAGEGVLLRDAGVAELDVHAVVDLSQDPPQLVSEDIAVHTLHGPHPELEMSDEEFFGFLCGALR